MEKYNHTVTQDEVGLSINQIIKANFKFSSRFKTKMKYQQLVDLNDIQTPGFKKPEEDSILTLFNSVGVMSSPWE